MRAVWRWIAAHLPKGLVLACAQRVHDRAMADFKPPRRFDVISTWEAMYHWEHYA